jgi:aminoglycoside phosphotransferase (APT) family kinase protein
MHSQECQRISDFARRRNGGSPDLRLRTVPLLGGLENCGVFKVEVTWTVSGRPCSDVFVAKRLVDRAIREVAVWKALMGTAAAETMPAMYGAQSVDEDEAYLYLEYVEQSVAWPWRDTSTSVAVLKAVADVHSAFLDSGGPFDVWDYESELAQSANLTVELFAATLLAGVALGERPMLRALERMIGMLPSMRVALKSWGTTLLHGDVHAGNAIVRRKGGEVSAVLVDWGRARLGSPLEDVSSWLQSAGFWEPEVRRRHDTLFRSYLRARQLSDRLTPELRELYWVAAASNAMAGALRYHLSVILDSARSDDEQFRSHGALRDWLRIIRRADACWRV